MENLFNNTIQIIKETDNTIYVNDSTVIPTWLAKRYIEVAEKSYSGTKLVGRISTTEFSKSDKQILLAQQRLKSPYKTTVNVTNIINSTLGSIVHESILEEEPKRKEKQLCGFTISGQTDKLENDILYDLKHVSVFAGKDLLRELQMCPEYNELPLEDLHVKYPSLFKYLSQLAIYNWLYDLTSTYGYITFIFNNWSFMDKTTIPNKNMEIKLNLPSHDKVVEYLTKRLQKLISYQESGYLPDCDNNALGSATSSTFKLCKPGKTRKVNKSPTCNTLDEISLAQFDFPGTIIVENKTNSDPTLCLKWCPYNQLNSKNETICTQGEQIKQNFKE